jgi:hypothetical protein
MVRITGLSLINGQALHYPTLSSNGSATDWKKSVEMSSPRPTPRPQSASHNIDCGPFILTPRRSCSSQILHYSQLRVRPAFDPETPMFPVRTAGYSSLGIQGKGVVQILILNLHDKRCAFCSPSLPLLLLRRPVGHGTSTEFQ